MANYQTGGLLELSFLTALHAIVLEGSVVQKILVTILSELILLGCFNFGRRYMEINIWFPSTLSSPEYS